MRKTFENVTRITAYDKGEFVFCEIYHCSDPVQAFSEFREQQPKLSDCVTTIEPIGMIIYSE